MNSRINREFRRLFQSLPGRVQQQARRAYELFKANPLHPGLRFKQVWPDPPIYSVRVGKNHRAVGVFRGDTVVWFWIGSHADYDKLLDSLSG